MLRDPTLLDFTLTPRERRAVAEFARLARERFGSRLARVLLYGSRARGDAEEDSDIDVLVPLKDQPAPEDQRWAFAESGRIAIEDEVCVYLMPARRGARRLPVSAQKPSWRKHPPW